MAYPTKGIELVVPSVAELATLGGGWGFNFARRGHDYAVRVYRSGLSIERDGAKVARWDDVPAIVQKLIVKTRDLYAAEFQQEHGARGLAPRPHTGGHEDDRADGESA